MEKEQPVVWEKHSGKKQAEYVELYATSQDNSRKKVIQEILVTFRFLTFPPLRPIKWSLDDHNPNQGLLQKIKGGTEKFEYQA